MALQIQNCKPSFFGPGPHFIPLPAESFDDVGGPDYGGPMASRSAAFSISTFIPKLKDCSYHGGRTARVQSVALVGQK
jgi:hypothetical protein